MVTLASGKIISAVSNFRIEPADLPTYALIGDVNHPFKDRFPSGVSPGITLATDQNGYQFYGTATSANVLASARNISLSGSLSGNVLFNGSNDVVITSNLINVLNSNVTANTYYTKVQVASNGLVTSANAMIGRDVYDALGYTPPSIILFQGDVTGNTQSNGTVWTSNIYLNSTNVSPGYYSNVRVDSSGRVIAANNNNAVPTQGIILWPNILIPTGWAECNGQTVTTSAGIITTPNLTAPNGTKYIIRIS
jgi:hypothetical protein